MRARIICLLLVLTAATGCPVRKPDLELAAAEKAIADARNRACAPETVAAAETLLAESKALYAKQEFSSSLAKANEAERLAKQALASEACNKQGSGAGSSPPPVDPNLDRASASDAAGRSADLGSIDQTIYFDYNDASIREDGKSILTRMSSTLMKDGSVKIEIEGHCDDRGSTEYNLHLGERRARAVEKYLLTQGVKAGQISTISYGEERPVDLAVNDAAWAKNRRAEVKRAK